MTRSQFVRVEAEGRRVVFFEFGAASTKPLFTDARRTPLVPQPPRTSYHWRAFDEWNEKRTRI